MQIDNRHFASKPLLSIHIPKTGGTTLREILLKRFTTNLYLDYGYDTNIKNPQSKIEAIHTHNPYEVYENILQNPKVLTILREPLERAISHYYYWFNIPLSQDPEPHGEIYIKHFHDNRSDLETFLLSGDDWMKNIYTEHFLSPLQKPEDFWFVGFLETFNEDIADLQRLLGMKPKTFPVLNKGKTPSESLPDQIKLDFYKSNQKDKNFYDMMLNERLKRKNTIGAWTTTKSNGNLQYKVKEKLKTTKKKIKEFL